jgi:hypothetical protein
MRITPVQISGNVINRDPNGLQASPNSGARATGECYNCGVVLSRVGLKWYSGQNWLSEGPRPFFAMNCPNCKAVWAYFRVNGAPTLLVNLQSRPAGTPMAQWLQNQLLYGQLAPPPARSGFGRFEYILGTMGEQEALTYR